MALAINTQEYWDHRFASGHWEQMDGRSQTTAFAEAQVRLLRLPPTFSGSLLDFGCGLGDALAIFKASYPSAKLFGVDHSREAIELCRKRYGDIATFVCGSHESVPEVDVIVASNVLEHIENDLETARLLASKCAEFYVFVPYMERPLCSEHVNGYTRESFSALSVLETKVFLSRGWSQYGRALWVDVYLKNLVRSLLGRKLVNRKKQIMFRIGSVGTAAGA
jgi:SAM-dependent methyltransferase